MRHFVAALAFFALGIGAVSCKSLAAEDRAPSLSLWFAENSPWNSLIGGTEAADYSDAAMATYLARAREINMNWGSAGVYVIYSHSATRNIRSLIFQDGNLVKWSIPRVPVSGDLIRAAIYRLEQKNTDGMTCLVDIPEQRFLSFWQPRPAPNGIAITTGGITPFSGMGWSRVGPQLPSLGRAAGANYCGGLIRADEMRRGEINHALALAWPKDLIRAPASPYGALQYPASNTDGVNLISFAAVPMGARLQLDPSLSDQRLSALGLSRSADLVIAHALQRYGGYIVDSNSATMGGSIYFESRYNMGDKVYGATNPWPLAVISHLRFVKPPALQPLDTSAPDRDAL